MAERMTVPSERSASDVLDSIPDPARQRDATAAVALITEVTGAEPTVWGEVMIGFGRQPYTTADGRQHEWFAVGLAPRKSALTFYGLTYYGSNTDLLERLGPHTTGKGCLYVKRLDQVDRDVLTELVRRAWRANHQPAAPGSGGPAQA
jgi:hypothetical protein